MSTIHTIESVVRILFWLWVSGCVFWFITTVARTRDVEKLRDEVYAMRATLLQMWKSQIDTEKYTLEHHQRESEIRDLEHGIMQQMSRGIDATTRVIKQIEMKELNKEAAKLVKK